MLKRMKLSDKVLLVFFAFSTLLIFLVLFLFEGSFQQILILSNVVYLVAFFVTYSISRNFSKSITRLTEKVQEMTQGDFAGELKINRNDELGELVVAMNKLLSELKTGAAIDIYKHKEIKQAKTDFVSLASHQLRTPLSIIKWYIDFLLARDAGDLTPEQEKYLKEVYRSNERLIELVNALLDVSRIDLGTFAIEPEPTDIRERAERALERFLPEIKAKDINLEKRFDKLPELNLDPRLTKIVFENILSNSVKYTSRNGIIRFVIKKTSANILIKISDNGCGIPREQQPQIFTKLFRADNVKKIESMGTGLGLYIVKAVIEKSGGRIWFESPSKEFLPEDKKDKKESSDNKNKGGTTFFISIPLKGMKKKKGTKKLTSI